MANKIKKQLQWSAPEYTHYKRGVSWYWLTVIATVVLAVFALWRGNFLFAIFLVLAEIILIIWSRQKPRTVNFALNHEGVDIDQRKFYPYQQAHGFAIVTVSYAETPYAELVLKLKNHFSPHLKIPFHSGDTDKIKAFLLNHIPEIEYEESLTDHFLRIIKF